MENRLIQATWGTSRARIDADRFLITPSGVDYDRIRPEDIVEIRIADGSFAAGQRPSSEREMHRRIYAARGDVRAVIHTHSAALPNVRRVPGRPSHAGDRRPLRRLRRERLEEARGERVRGAALSRSLHHGKSRLYCGGSGS